MDGISLGWVFESEVERPARRAGHGTSRRQEELRRRGVDERAAERTERRELQAHRVDRDAGRHAARDARRSRRRSRSGFRGTERRARSGPGARRERCRAPKSQPNGNAPCVSVTAVTYELPATPFTFCDPDRSRSRRSREVQLELIGAPELDRVDGGRARQEVVASVPAHDAQERRVRERLQRVGRRLLSEDPDGREGRDARAVDGRGNVRAPWTTSCRRT